jgi:hypothetical protein
MMDKLNLVKHAQSNPQLIERCYLVDNNFAYRYDTKGDYKQHIKVFNFVPTYDKWCLTCEKKGVNQRCARCHSVYFCDRACQQKAWPIHKKHCSRNLFVLCLTCGEPNPSLKCKDCPVRFCSPKCQSGLLQTHIEFDCKYFNKTFASHT